MPPRRSIQVDLIASAVAGDVNRMEIDLSARWVSEAMAVGSQSLIIAKPSRARSASGHPGLNTRTRLVAA